MKILPWIVATASISAVIYVIQHAPSTSLDGTGGDFEEAAKRTGAWGTEQRVGGTGGQILGNLKKGAGSLTGNNELKGEGLLDEAVGALQDTTGKAAQAVNDSLQGLNRGQKD